LITGVDGIGGCVFVVFCVVLCHFVCLSCILGAVNLFLVHLVCFLMFWLLIVGCSCFVGGVG